MLERITQPDEIRYWPGDMPVEHRYTPGVAGEVFFTALRDRGVLLGSRCESCSYTEVGPQGTLVSFTIGFVGIEGEPLDETETFGLVRLDGADAVLLHRMLDVGDEPLEIGERVEAVIRNPNGREGSILDIEGFRAIE
jgi:uncharacterized OB-fold protein